MNHNNIVSRSSPLIFSYFPYCLKYSHGYIYLALESWRLGNQWVSRERLLGDAIAFPHLIPPLKAPALSFLPISLRKGIESGRQLAFCPGNPVFWRGSSKNSSGLNLDIRCSPWRAAMWLAYRLWLSGWVVPGRAAEAASKNFLETLILRADPCKAVWMTFVILCIFFNLPCFSFFFFKS